MKKLLLKFSYFTLIIFSFFILTQCKKETVPPDNKDNSNLVDSTNNKTGDTTTHVNTENNLVLIGGSVLNGELPLNSSVSTIAGQQGVEGNANGNGLDATFKGLRGITCDGENLYVLTTGDLDFSIWKTPSYIRKINIATKEVTTLYTFYELATGSTIGITTDGNFVYLASYGGVSKVNISDSIMSSVVSIQGENFYGLTYFNGKLFATTANEQICEINANTGEYTMNDVQDITLGGIAGITTDGKSLFIADMSSNQIQKVDIKTFEGSTLSSDIKLLNVEVLCTDGINVYFGKPSISGAIGKVNIETGETSFLFNISGYQDGSISDGRFASPTGLTSNGKSLFVSDGSYNSLIRQVE